MLDNLTKYERHSIFWICLILVLSVAYGFQQDENTVLVLAADHLMSLPIYLIATYSTVYILVPYFLLRNKILVFSIFFIFLIGLLAYIEMLKTTYLSMPLLFPEKDHYFKFSIINLSRSMFYILLPVIFFTSLKYINEWYLIHIQKNELEKEHVKKELSILKSQLQPGFLIDTLEILKERSKKLPEKAASGIEKVSELLSYILYDFNAPAVKLEKEIKLIRHYIDLQKLHLDPCTEINFRTIGNFKDVMIAPMLLFSMVEYLFKNIEYSGELPEVMLFLEKQDREINFWTECYNCPSLLTNSKGDRVMNNLQRRANLIYKDEHKLELKQQGNKFILHLNLNAE